jgi:cytoskeleton protein RodZ
MTAVNDLQLAEQGIGLRLRDARERAGLSTSDVAARLKMPVRVIDSLEAEDWGRAGAPVFVRGQIRSYAKLLGLSQDIRTTGVMGAIAPPVLKPRTYTPPLQRFAEQASRRAVYIVLTAAILVPVWLATRSQSGSGSAASLDASPQATQLAADGQREPATVRASIAPIPSRTARPALALEFEGDSWVEIHAADGSVVESGLLKAGDRRNFAAGEVSRMKLGNAAAVRVLNNGREQDLTPYLRASVARFAVSSDGSLAPPAE